MFVSLRLLVCAVALIASPALHANYVPLAWDRSVSSSVVGYKIYYGVASGVYTNSIDVGNITNTTITGLADNTTYYFAVKSYDIFSVLSDFSNETILMIYQTATLSPASRVNGRPAFNISGGVNVVPAVTNVVPGITTNVVPAVTNYQNYIYVVQASTNLVNWVPVQTNVAPFVFVDPNASQFSRRFYRTVNVPIPTVTSTFAFAPTNGSTTPYADGQFTVTVHGNASFPLQYVVQASTNLVDWVSIQTNTSPFTFVDANAGQFSQRFYRTYYLSP